MQHRWRDIKKRYNYTLILKNDALPAHIIQISHYLEMLILIHTILKNAAITPRD
jgi:hypothetical protein